MSMIITNPGVRLYQGSRFLVHSLFIYALDVSVFGIWSELKVWRKVYGPPFGSGYIRVLTFPAYGLFRLSGAIWYVVLISVTCVPVIFSQLFFYQWNSFFLYCAWLFFDDWCIFGIFWQFSVLRIFLSASTWKFFYVLSYMFDAFLRCIVMSFFETFAWWSICGGLLGDFPG